MKKLYLFITLVMMVLTVNAQTLNYDIINISSNASEELQRDTLVVSLLIESSDSNQVRVSQETTAKLNKVITALRTHRELKNTHVDRYSYFDNSKSGIFGKKWIDKATIQVESKDFKALSQFVVDLTNVAVAQNWFFKVSDEMKNSVEEELTIKAIRNIQKKAQYIAQAIGKKGNKYKVVELNISSVDRDNPVTLMQVRLGKENQDESTAPIPDMDGGKMTISIRISGKIQIQ